MATLFALAAFASEARADGDPLEALLARADAVTKEVVKLRGLKLKRKLERELVDRAELRRRVLALAEAPQTQSETGAEGLALARWGLVPLDTRYVELMIELLTDQVAGYYDPKTEKLTISKQAVDDPAWSELVLAHEIDHGLQDQAFDLEKFETVPASEGDAALARRALVEGDGVALTIELALARRNLDAPWGSATIAGELEKAMVLPAGDALDKAPLAVRERTLFPYRSGFAFVAALLKREPWSAVDAAFKRPPRSTEQILHPDKYVSDEKPVIVSLPIPAALSDHAVAHSTVWGEHGFSLFLRAHGISADVAAQAAAGWGGDRAITLVRAGDMRPERSVGVARLAWDSEADAIEAHEAAVRALDASLVGATAEHLDDRTRWLALDGTVNAVERRGATLTLVVGAPVRLAAALLDELGQASK